MKTEEIKQLVTSICITGSLQAAKEVKKLNENDKILFSYLAFNLVFTLQGQSDILAHWWAINYQDLFLSKLTENEFNAVQRLILGDS